MSMAAEVDQLALEPCPMGWRQVTGPEDAVGPRSIPLDE